MHCLSTLHWLCNVYDLVLFPASVADHREVVGELAECRVPFAHLRINTMHHACPVYVYTSCDGRPHTRWCERMTMLHIYMPCDVCVPKCYHIHERTAGVRRWHTGLSQSSHLVTDQLRHLVPNLAVCWHCGPVTGSHDDGFTRRPSRVGMATVC